MQGSQQKKVASLLLAVIMITVHGSASAGWLDKLKEAIAGGGDVHKALSVDDIGGGLKEALRVGTENVVENLGATGGFDLDPQIHIPLPQALEQVNSVLARVRMDGMLLDLETRLNRAAEAATPKAQELFVEAINAMTLDDVMAIYDGPEDAATQYFRSKMSGSLALEMTPVVDQSLTEVGAAKSYADIMGYYNGLPFMPEVDADLSDYVVEKGLDGIFHYLAQEEAAIRENPAKRTTELLKRVFE
ncbi:MAG: hypothetical protein ACI87W_003126 [Halieaceae bacterium]|jgi:hypothetical protein